MSLSLNTGDGPLSYISIIHLRIMLYCSGFVRRLPHISVRAKIARKWRRCDWVGIRRWSSRQCDRRASQVNKWFDWLASSQVNKRFVLLACPQPQCATTKQITSYRSPIIFCSYCINFPILLINNVLLHQSMQSGNYGYRLFQKITLTQSKSPLRQYGPWRQHRC